MCAMRMCTHPDRILRILEWVSWAGLGVYKTLPVAVRPEPSASEE